MLTACLCWRFLHRSDNVWLFYNGKSMIVLSSSVCSCSCCCCRCHVYIGRKKNGSCMYVPVHCVHSNNNTSNGSLVHVWLCANFGGFTEYAHFHQTLFKHISCFCPSENTPSHIIFVVRALVSTLIHIDTAHTHAHAHQVLIRFRLYLSQRAWMGCFMLLLFFFYSIPFVIVMSAINVDSYPKSIMTYTSIEFICSHSIRDWIKCNLWENCTAKF